jgi:hypothetical protein
LIHLRFKDLVDRDGRARSKCSVTEKSRTVRHFVCSPNLVSCVEKFFQEELSKLGCETGNAEGEGEKEQAKGDAKGDEKGDAKEEPPEDAKAKKDKALNLHLFDPRKRVARNVLHGRLKKLAEKAGIQANVHAHAFRHTLVGTLVSAGNSIELVSKFMGHRNVQTTERHYFVPTSDEVFEAMRNPFFPKRNRDERQDDETLRAEAVRWQEELLKTKTAHEKSVTLLRTKKQKLFDLVTYYNNLLAKASQEAKTAQDVAKQVNQDVPNLGRLLTLVKDS